MEKITLDGEDFYYEEYIDYTYSGNYPKTRFYKYEGKKQIKETYGFFDLRKRFVEKDSYAYYFTLNLHITDARKTKEDIKNAIYKEIGTKQRREEIEKGEII
jgi:hypothetical protein